MSVNDLPMEADSASKHNRLNILFSSWNVYCRRVFYAAQNWNSNIWSSRVLWQLHKEP